MAEEAAAAPLAAAALEGGGSLPAPCAAPLPAAALNPPGPLPGADGEAGERWEAAGDSWPKEDFSMEEERPELVLGETVAVPPEAGEEAEDTTELGPLPLPPATLTYSGGYCCACCAAAA